MQHIKRAILFFLFITMLTLSAQAYEPEITDGQENIVRRARQLIEIEWTPLRDIHQWDYEGTFEADTTYTGVPYGQPVETKGYVGWNIGFEDFLEAVGDVNSRFYSEYSWYTKVAPCFSIDCSGFVSYAWDADERFTTRNLHEYGQFVENQSINAIQVGDALNKSSSHAALVTAVDLARDGSVQGIVIMEATPPITKTTGYGTLGSNSLEYFQSRYFDNGYSLYRNPNRHNVDYTHSCAVPIDGDYCDNCEEKQPINLPFSDVADDAWYRSAVALVYRYGLYNGTGANSFSPDQNMTRGMFATVLSRLEDIPSTIDGEFALVAGTEVRLRAEPNTESAVLGYLDIYDPVGVIDHSGEWYKVRANSSEGWIRGDLLMVYDGRITDLEEGQYYTNAVKWACLMGIATAGGGDFRAGDSILRQDMALMLYNYAKTEGIALTSAGHGSFSDDAAISSYAREAVYALKNHGIISGMGDGSFAPTGTANRGQVAQIFKNFLDA